jgi:hypothetical protein
MSCNCNAKYDNKIPCCCSTGTTVVCTTTQCPNTQPCNETVETNCVIYNKEHDCIDITSGMTVTEVVDIILNKLNLIDCTTTIAPVCQCYLLTNNSGNEGDNIGYSYYNCNEDLVEDILYPNQRTYVCSITYPTVDDYTKLKIGTIGNLTCSGEESNCVNPTTKCYSVSAEQGVVDYQYIDGTGTLQFDNLASGDTGTLFAWENSIDKISGSGILTIALSNDCD